ncbi:MAG: DivIVA domain-containing protein [Propionibacteriaceae bacterium]|nr:DivIVA domain-containing protein [Propionibacteriaceae bacterium]
MTLTVDEVRNVRFPMARQPNEDGYRASAVDNFIDRLEVSYAEIVEENQRLKASAGAGGDEHTRAQLASLSRERDDLVAQNGQLAGQVAELKQQVLSASASASASDSNQTMALRAQIDDLNRANQDLRVQLTSRPSDQSSGQVAQMNQQLSQANQQLAQASQENATLQSKVMYLQNQVNDLNAQVALQPASVLPSEGDTRRIVVTTSSEAAPAVVLLVEQTLQQVQTLMDNAQVEIDQRRTEAETEARRLVDSATVQAEDLSRRAQTDADSIHADANATAGRLVAEARGRAASIDSEAEQRRTLIQTQLDKERDVLSDRIGQLRDFEAKYRSGMAEHLQRQLESLNETQFAPSYRPELLDASATREPGSVLH